MRGFERAALFNPPQHRQQLDRLDVSDLARAKPREGFGFQSSNDQAGVAAVPVLREAVEPLARDRFEGVLYAFDLFELRHLRAALGSVPAATLCRASSRRSRASFSGTSG
jgi:hypothetical protein